MARETIDEQMARYESELRRKNQDPDDEEWVIETLAEYRGEITEKERLWNLEESKKSISGRNNGGKEAREEEGEEGAILLCDGKGCSSEMSLSDAGLQAVPEGDWFCPDCTIKAKMRGAAKTGRSSRAGGGSPRRKKLRAEKDDNDYCDENRMNGSSGDESVILLCDGCDREMTLAEAGLDTIPDGDWFCGDCETERTSSSRSRAATPSGPAAGRSTTPSRTLLGSSTKKRGASTPKKSTAPAVSCTGASAAPTASRALPDDQKKPLAPMFSPRTATPDANSLTNKSLSKKSPPRGAIHLPASSPPSVVGIRSTATSSSSKGSRSSIKNKKAPKKLTSNQSKQQQHMSQLTMWGFLKICNPVESGHLVDLTRGEGAHPDSGAVAAVNSRVDLVTP